MSKGKVQGLVTIPDKTDSTKSSMSICSLFKDGDDFEMDAMLSSQEMRCTYRAVSVTDLFWIESADFGDVIDEYVRRPRFVLLFFCARAGSSSRSSFGSR